MPYDSIDVLKNASEECANRNAKAHFQRALDSYTRPLPLCRMLTESDLGTRSTFPHGLLGGLPPISYSELDTSPILRDLTVPNCHDGQRKLSFALLEFLANAMITLNCRQEDIFLVYAGASGLASTIAYHAFPKVCQVLFDPAPNTITHIPQSFKNIRIFRETYRIPPAAFASEKQKITIFTNDAGWFDDKVAAYCREVLWPASKRRYLLFASDVRTKEEEMSIAHDMHDQMRWTLILDAATYMHKFRIPYADAPEAEQAYALYHNFNDIDVSRLTKVSRDQITGTRETFPYLEGDIYIQVYAHPRTAELRLMGFKDKTGFGLKRYSAKAIEDAMATFNIAYRMHARYEYQAHNLLHPHLPLVYDFVAEHSIISTCAHLTEANPSQLHANINNTLTRLNSKNLLILPFVSASIQESKKKITHIPYYMYRWATTMTHIVPETSKYYIMQRFLKKS